MATRKRLFCCSLTHRCPACHMDAYKHGYQLVIFNFHKPCFKRVPQYEKPPRKHSLLLTCIFIQQLGYPRNFLVDMHLSCLWTLTYCFFAVVSTNKPLCQPRMFDGAMDCQENLWKIQMCQPWMFYGAVECHENFWKIQRCQPWMFCGAVECHENLWKKWEYRFCVRFWGMVYGNNVSSRNGRFHLYFTALWTATRTFGKE